jgi:DNA end-binding protein Ku
MPATVWRGYISFGLVSFPVRLFSAARAEAVHFHLLHKKDLSRVKEVWFCAEEDKPVDRADLAKGYETSKGNYVVVEDEELKKIAPPTASTMDIIQFVETDEVDPIYFEHSYYVGPGDNLDKPYTLFFEALKQTGYAAIAKLSMHGREHVVLIRPSGGGLLLHTLFYSNELHEAKRQTAPAKLDLSRKELDLAKSLVKQLAAPFKPDEFEDTYRKNVEKLIDQKKKGKPVTLAEPRRKAPVIDLMEALQRSLKNSSGSAKETKSKKSSKTVRKRKIA